MGDDRNKLYKRSLIFSLSVFPFMLSIALIDFIIPIKYDIVLENLPLFGFLVTIAWISSSIFDFAVGYLTDRIGIKRTIQLGVIFSFIGGLIFALSSNFLIMTFGIFIWGLSYIMLTVPSDTYVLSRFPRNYRGTSYSKMYFLYDISYAIAPIIGYLLIINYSINFAIIAASIFSILTIIALFFMKEDNKEQTYSEMKKIITKNLLIKKGFKDLFSMNKKEMALLLNMVIFGMWFMTILIGAPLLFFHEDRNLFNSAILTFSFMIPFAISELIYGNFANSRKNRKIMINFGFAGSVILLIIFYFVKDFILLSILAFLITLFVNMAWTANEIYISEYLPNGRKGEFMGVYASGKDIGFDLAPLFYGTLAFFGLKIPFLFIGLLIFLAGLNFFICWKKD